MKYKILHDAKEKTYAVIMETGDEVQENLKAFAHKENLKASHFTAIGAFKEVTLGYFDIEKKEYKKIPVEEQVEVLVLAGDISLYEDQPKIHAHVVVGKSDGSTRGGHLLKAVVRPTLEIILTESPGWLCRQMDEEMEIPLIKL